MYVCKKNYSTNTRPHAHGLRHHTRASAQRKHHFPQLLTLGFQLGALPTELKCHVDTCGMQGKVYPVWFNLHMFTPSHVYTQGWYQLT